MRRALLLSGALVLTFLAQEIAGSAFAQQPRWAAVDANREVSAPVVWAPTEALARERAIEACERVSKTCAGGPATTNEMDDTFAVMCCTQPKLGCAIAAAGDRQEAQKSVRKSFSEAGYTNCSVRHYISAGSGKKQ